MRYEHVKNLPSPQFKRLVGVGHQTFRSMVWVMRMQTSPRLKSGRPTKLSLQDQILETLQYWREYRTYFHIGQTWGVSEATVCRIVHHVENTLIRSGCSTSVARARWTGPTPAPKKATSWKKRFSPCLGTEIFDGRDGADFQMHKGLAGQSQAKVPLPPADVVKQLLMHEAAIGKPRDHLICRHESVHLIEHRLIGFKTDLGTPAAHSSPCQRNRPTTREQGGTDEHNRREDRRIQGHVEARLRRPIQQGCPHNWPIPLRWVNGWMV
jgi:hypothetical protein